MIIMHSSIALLQERFRELQRVKEMREERELLKMMLNSDHRPSKQYFTSNSINHPSTITTCYYEPSTRLFFQPELIAIPSCRSPSSPSPPPPPPPPPPPRVSLSLWPTSSQDDKKKKTSAGVPLMMTDCASKHCLHASSCEDWDSNSADSDGVDTTLRL